MDYQELYSILPKSHWLWTVQDTRQWLNYIGLNSLQEKFQQSSVDGSILDCLSQADLIDQLHITSKIIVKKLMNWIKNGLPAFDKYVESRNHEIEERLKLQTSKMSILQRQRTNYKEQCIKEQRIKPRQPSLTEQPKRAEANELIIRNVEQNQTNNYYLKEKGGSIGRQASNEIVIMDEFVSRRHAEIIYQRDRYYIKDCASSSGTFIKIMEKMELRSGMIIEMGSNQFEINIDAFNTLSVVVIDGPNLDYYKEMKDMDTYSFGRKESNYVSFPDDQHLSGIHSKIFKLKGRWYIQDIATTNGTWFRLSPEGVQSESFLLEDKTQFKLSSNLIYECILNTNNRRTHKTAEEKCFYCRVQQRNAMIFPCKHAMFCYECLLRQKECPMCESPIADIVKIFTA